MFYIISFIHPQRPFFNFLFHPLFFAHWPPNGVQNTILAPLQGGLGGTCPFGEVVTLVRLFHVYNQ
jgi:hypothetical protein